MHLGMALHGLHKLGLKSWYWGRLLSLFNTGLSYGIKVQGVCKQQQQQAMMMMMWFDTVHHLWLCVSTEHRCYKHRVHLSSSSRIAVADTVFWGGGGPHSLISCYLASPGPICPIPFPCNPTWARSSLKPSWKKENATAPEFQGWRVEACRTSGHSPNSVMSRLLPFKEIVNLPAVT